jgi:hypothetical protein
VLRKVVVYHTKKHKNVKKKFGYDLKLLSFKKNKTLNLQGIPTLSKIHIYSKMMKKKHVMYLDNYKHLL